MRKRTESDVNETKRKKGTTKQVKHNAKKQKKNSNKKLRTHIR